MPLCPLDPPPRRPIGCNLSRISFNPEVVIQRLHERDVTCLVLFTLFWSVLPARAQEDEPEDRWQVAAEFSLTDQSGNQVLTLLTGGLNITHLQREDFRLNATVETRYGRSEGELVARNHQAGLAFDLRPTSRWSPFLLIDAERDEFKQLDLRLSSGAGVKHTFHRSDDGRTESSLSLALLHALERVETTPPDGSAGRADPRPVETSHRARWSLRARTSREIRDGVTLRHLTLYQPVVQDMASYLLRVDTGLKILLTKRLALSVDYQLKRDARPPEGVEPNDRLLKTGLIIDF